MRKVTRSARNSVQQPPGAAEVIFGASSDLISYQHFIFVHSRVHAVERLNDQWQECWCDRGRCRGFWARCQQIETPPIELTDNVQHQPSLEGQIQNQLMLPISEPWSLRVICTTDRWSVRLRGPLTTTPCAIYQSASQWLGNGPNRAACQSARGSVTVCLCPWTPEADRRAEPPKLLSSSHVFLVFCRSIHHINTPSFKCSYHLSACSCHGSERWASRELGHANASLVSAILISCVFAPLHPLLHSLRGDDI